MSFVIKDDDGVLDKYNEIWNKIKNTLNIKFPSMLVYDEKYIKAELRKINGVIKNQNFQVMKYQKSLQIPLVFTKLPKILEDSKDKIRKIKMPEFINAELESDSTFDSE